ncbi:MAG: hypothetical protein IPP53_12890 [Bacteroidetes bacterium]|nr:hypothetical protein [Bacteroidota bacterium]
MASNIGFSSIDGYVYDAIKFDLSILPHTELIPKLGWFDRILIRLAITEYTMDPICNIWIEIMVVFNYLGSDFLVLGSQRMKKYGME